jgi:hypothetical protein
VNGHFGHPFCSNTKKVLLLQTYNTILNEKGIISADAGTGWSQHSAGTTIYR